MRRNPDGTYTRTMPNGVSHHFDSDGFQTSTVDRNGITTTYAYEGTEQHKRLIRITDPAGLETVFTYDNGKISSITDPAGRITQFEVDENGDLLRIVNPDLTERRFEYDAEHLMTAQIDASGLRSEYVYDHHGCIAETIKGVGTPEEQHRYFQASVNQGLINDLPPGVGTRDNPAPVVRPESIQESYTNAAGQTELYHTNRYGMRTSIEDPAGRTTLMERDEFNNLTMVTSPEGRQVAYQYDRKGNVTKITNLGTNPPAETLIEYHETWNRPTRVEDPEGKVWTMEYDPDNGNLLTITDPHLRVTAYTYNARGQVETVTNPEQESARFEYYADTGNLRKIIADPDGLALETRFEYDAYGNVSKTTDPNLKETTFVYDAMNLLRFATDSAGRTTEYQYQPAYGTDSAWSFAPLAELARIIDSRGITTVEYGYDALHRPVSETNAIGKTWAWTYDDADRVRSSTDPKGQEITYTYDEAGRLTSKVLPGDGDTETVSYDYDGDDKLVRIADGDSDLSFAYNDAGQLESYTSATAGQPALTLSYTHNLDGTVASMTDPTGETAFVYNDTNGLTRITDSAGRAFQFSYDSAGRRTELDAENGTSVTYGYDPAARLESILHEVGTEPLLSLAYGLDPAGTIESLTDADGLHTYGYDDAYQLTSAIHPNPPVNPDESYTYDLLGNRISSHLSGLHLHNAANQLLEDDEYVYGYDDNGNLATRVRTSDGDTALYTYDAEDRLIRVESTGGRWVTYRYDALGRRIEKNVNDTSTRYAYSGEDILFEYDGANNVVARYTHGPGIDEPLAAHRDTTGDGTLDSAFYYHADHLGSVRVLTDETGAVVGAYTYDAFGQIVAQTGEIPNPYTYTSREWDPEAGMFFYRARYYDASSGRFVSPDPIGFASGPNQFRYVNNNPVALVDPWGLCWSIRGEEGGRRGSPPGRRPPTQKPPRTRPKPSDRPKVEPGLPGGARPIEDLLGPGWRPEEGVFGPDTPGSDWPFPSPRSLQPTWLAG